MTGAQTAPGADHLMPTYARYPVRFVRGSGAQLWDDEGNEYLDFLAGISVSSVGHCHPKVVEAIRAQAGELLHVGNLFYTEPMTRLAQRLAESAPYVRPWKPRCSTTISPPLLALRASFSAASTASAPEFVKNTVPPRDPDASRCASRLIGSV